VAKEPIQYVLAAFAIGVAGLTAFVWFHRRSDESRRTSHGNKEQVQTFASQLATLHTKEKEITASKRIRAMWRRTILIITQAGPPCSKSSPVIRIGPSTRIQFTLGSVGAHKWTKRKFDGQTGELLSLISPRRISTTQFPASLNQKLHHRAEVV
jgi:hypothetical protein